MPITANVTNEQITATVGETKIDVAVSGGFGPSGAAGSNGQAATIAVGTVTTGAPGSSASVVNAGTTSAAVLNFTIPAGATGATGPAGPQGPAGAAGASSWDDITGKPSTFAPSAHAASHEAGGVDQLFDQDLNTTDDPSFNTVNALYGGTLVSDQAGEWTVVVASDGNSSGTITLTGTQDSPPYGAVSLVISALGITFPDSSVQATAYTGKIGTVAGLVLKTGTDGVIEALAMGTAGQVLKINSGATGVEWVSLGSAASASTTDFAAASHNHAASAITSGTLDIARIPTGTSSTTVALGNHTHAQLHDRSHAITSSSDHTATAWRLFYSNGSGVITELTLGSSGQALLSNGASAAPSWGSAGSNSASDLTVGTLAYARMADPTVTSPSQITASQNDYSGFARGINRFSTNGAYNLTGMAAGSDGEVRVLTNVGTTAANTLTIKDESSSSTAANRFSVPWNSDCVIQAEGSVAVFYDGTSQRWRVL